MDRALLVAAVVGVVQGIFEWLPISSEGNVALALSVLGRSPEEAVAFALFLHLGTALSATVYYRERIAGLLRALPSWRPGGDGDDATLGFLAVATVASGVVGIGAYQTVIGLVSETGGGLFVVAVGVLLVGTGVFQRVSTDRAVETRTTPGLADAVLVGAPGRRPGSSCCAGTRSHGRSSCRSCCRSRPHWERACWRTRTPGSRRRRRRPSSRWVSRPSSATRPSTHSCAWSNGWRSGRCVSGSAGWRWWVESY